MHNSLPRNGGSSQQISPNRVHPALPLSQSNTVPFPAGGRAAAPQQAAPSRLHLLLKLEGDIRQQPGRAALMFHALNETAVLLGQQQGFYFRANNRGRFICNGASDVAQVDARAPLVAALESVVNGLADRNQAQAVNLQVALRSASFPQPHGLWLPLLNAKGKAFAGFLFNRNDPWAEDVRTIAERVAQAYAHGFRVHSPPHLLRKPSLNKPAFWLLPLAVLLLAAVPVPLTTLAPFEVVPRSPMPVGAGIDGVIKSVAVAPNDEVQAGQLLLTLDDTALSAERDIARQRMTVAEAKLSTARSGAFADADSKRAIATLTKELELAEAEQALAESRLARTRVVATEAGLVVFSSVSDILGKPVRVGEKIMDIADPGNVAVRVDVGQHDSIALPESQNMRLFLDAAPLSPRHARIYEKSFHAVERLPGQLSYTVKAAFDDGDVAMPRMGMRGTAQLIGQNVPLGFYILRRPLATLRQWAGL